MARRTRAGREGRMAARKAATASEAIWPGIAGGRYRPLSDADMDKVHAAALTILEKTGIGEPLDELLDKVLAALLTQDVNVGVLIQKSSLMLADLAVGDEPLALALETRGRLPSAAMPLVTPILDEILKGALVPDKWSMIGALPNHIDGLRQVQIADAIIRSCERGEPVSLA